MRAWSAFVVVATAGPARLYTALQTPGSLMGTHPGQFAGAATLSCSEPLNSQVSNGNQVVVQHAGGSRGGQLGQRRARECCTHSHAGSPWTRWWREERSEAAPDPPGASLHRLQGTKRLLLALALKLHWLAVGSLLHFGGAASRLAVVACRLWAIAASWSLEAGLPATPRRDAIWQAPAVLSRSCPACAHSSTELD